MQPSDFLCRTDFLCKALGGQKQGKSSKRAKFGAAGGDMRVTEFPIAEKLIAGLLVFVQPEY